ncbi:MAG: DUF3455 domain-containing protein [Usitatibacter sp.]
MHRRVLPLVLLIAVSGVVVAAIPEPKGLSPTLRPPEGEVPAFMLNAEGVQIYACRPAADDPKTFRWEFVGPEATLRENGKPVGRHGAGPVWESTTDKSSVKGAARKGQDGGAGNIPWLLLAATPSPGPGRFSGVTSIVRATTKGGVDPVGGCDASASGKQSRVPYTADYYFYKRK